MTRATLLRGGSSDCKEWLENRVEELIGKRLTDEQRAAQFEKVLNAEAKAGWEPVTSLLTRNTVQTVGGGVTTRDSTSFVAFRRPR